ncbi:TonB-dependent receptor [Oleiphilus messinensis]|uniref:TonB-dependent receptor n=1 Tax=Oleiphilus messinensis TaxID=141451 RepID=A0A1Y0I597_9GAMM|nr:TonB-dependent receptor [Oleiphilus messinensis]ARU54966.1 TonB-dependent receptor [Oleiphilus messinensis]
MGIKIKSPVQQLQLPLAIALITSQGLLKAQEAPEQENQTSTKKLEEVIVTGTKTGAKSLQTVPSSITAINSTGLEEAGMENIEDLKLQTPGLNINRNGQATRIYIRGIGTNLDFVGSDPSVTVHIDGVYQPRPTTSLIDFLDVERVEVLRGPQGTLYGRNSIGGTINVISKTPGPETDANASVQLGNYDEVRVNANLSGEMAENIYGSIAVQKAKRDPYVDNVSPTGIDGLMDEDSTSTRGALRFLFAERGELILRGDYTTIDEATGAYKSTGLGVTGQPAPLGEQVIIPSDPWDMHISYDDPFVDQKAWGTSAKLSWDLSDEWTISSLTAYRDNTFDTIEDTDGSNIDALVTELAERQDQLSEEIQLNLTTDRMSWVAGLFYLEEEHSTLGIVNVNLPGLANNLDAQNETTAYALFTEGTYAVTENLNASLGLRYSYEEKEFNNVQRLMAGTNQIGGFEVSNKDDWDAWSPKASVDYTFNNGPMLYATVSRGFKSGGYNFTSGDAQYDPEFVWSYESGVKTELLDSLRTNVAWFYYDYTDLQVSAFTQPGVLSISNAADATIYGVELETEWRPIYDLLIGFNYAYLKTEYDKYLAPSGPVVVDVSGNKLNSAPEHKVSTVVQYEHFIGIGTLRYRAEWSWQDKVYFTAFNENVSSQGAYSVVNARINLLSADERWEVQIFGENLGDEDYSTSSREFPAASTGVTRDINPPRTFGAKFTYHLI